MPNPKPAVTSRPYVYPHTLAELLQMDDVAYDDAVAQDVYATTAWQSPFMDSSLIHRTESSLVGRMGRVEASIRRLAEDPLCDAIRYGKARSFHRMLQIAVERTERRIAHEAGGGQGWIRAWKEFANRLADELENSDAAEALDEIVIPIGNLTARQWLDSRRLKDPSRIPTWAEVAA
ncbi:hypothetical protein BKA24_001793 [Microbacterium marinum]|uniref:Uncharacterized protein n=1 Tax=Microbacterium marinum TaxID=421115 RepID=A0A7W7BSV7_9MICO|nr:hypothetical protein [Microbacterium marinum]MBB4667084.1 hypothetical protein [Microbacterium marinum]